jgi:hypothetical protein
MYPSENIKFSHLNKKSSKSYLVLVLGGLLNLTAVPWSLQTTTSSAVLGPTTPRPHNVDDYGAEGNITNVVNNAHQYLSNYQFQNCMKRFSIPNTNTKQVNNHEISKWQVVWFFFPL